MTAILVVMGGTLTSIDSVVVVEDGAVEQTLAALTAAVNGLAVFQTFKVEPLERVLGSFSDDEVEGETRLGCSVCGRTWDVGDSDAEEPERFCSHDCELEVQ
jgi:hypothetical protein